MFIMTNTLTTISHDKTYIETLRSAATQAVIALKLLVNKDRLILLNQLLHGEMCVSELQELLGVS